MTNPGPSILTNNNNQAVQYDPITGTMFAGGSVISTGVTSIPGVTQNGITNDAAAFQAYLTSIGSTLTNITISGPMLLGASLTVPSTVQLRFTGAGLFRTNAGVTITINGLVNAGQWQIFDISGGGTITGTLNNPFIYSNWFGAKPDGVTDNAATLNAVYALGLSAGGAEIRYSAGTYKVNSVLNGNGSTAATFGCPTHTGVDEQGSVPTLIDGSGIPGTTTPTFYFRGGSGQSTSAQMRNIGVSGNSNNTAIQHQGLGGFKYDRCRVGGCTNGWLLANVDAGSFTEFVTIEGSITSTSCTNPLTYFVGSGNNSFHGSGFSGTKSRLNLSGAASTGIVIGTGAFVYNAPLNAQVFTTGITAPLNLIVNNATINVGFVGELSLEVGTQVVTLASGRVWFGGTIRANGLTTGTGANVVAGSLTRVRTMGSFADGSYSYTGAETNSFLTLTTGANTIVSNIAATSRIVELNIVATNYNYRYMLLIDVDGSGGAGYVRSMLGYDPAGVLLTAAPAAAAVSATLSSTWPRQTAAYLCYFTGGDTRLVTLTNGATTATWSGGLNNASSTVISVIGLPTPLRALNTASYYDPLFTVDTSGRLVITNSNWPASGVTAYMNEIQASTGIQGNGHILF